MTAANKYKEGRFPRGPGPQGNPSVFLGHIKSATDQKEY